MTEFTQVRTDFDIAASVSAVLRDRSVQWSRGSACNWVDGYVYRGWLTLKGQVDWDYQKQAAAETVHNLAGLSGITNEIQVKPRPLPGADLVREGLRRTGNHLRTHNIVISAQGTDRIFTAVTDSWFDQPAVSAPRRSGLAVRSVLDREIVRRQPSSA